MTRPGPSGTTATGRPGQPDVVVIGGGPVGLAAAIGLSRAGVRSILLERHPGTAIHPKARGVDVRTMEVLRRWDLEGPVRAAGLPAEEHGFFFRGESLASPEFARYGGGGQSSDAERLSPATWLVIGQDALEPVLLDGARRLGLADIRFGWEAVDLGQDAAGVEVTAVERATGRTETIRASFVIGADGAGSGTRERLGVELEGRGPLVWNASILFRADLGPLIADRRSAVYYLAPSADVRPRGYPMSVGNPPPNGVILTIDGRERWLLVVGLESGEAAPPDGEAATALVRRAIGRPELAVEVLGVLPWTPAARVAARYRTGRVFLAGDAAHEMTPSGAFGLNVGIQDAHNLAWKLGLVARGLAGDALLDTYDPERRPIGRFATEQSYLQFSGAHAPKPFGNWGVILGSRYASSAVVPDGTEAAAVADPATDYIPQARPGHRLPHAWLGGGDGSGRRSTVDLVGDGFTVLSRDPAWTRVAADAADRLGLPIAGCLLTGDLVPADAPTFDAAFGIGDHGAVLVRPDGYVAWRTVDDPGRHGPDLESALRSILARG